MPRKLTVKAMFTSKPPKLGTRGHDVFLVNVVNDGRESNASETTSVFLKFFVTSGAAAPLQ